MATTSVVAPFTPALRAAAERIAGVLADRGIDVSGQTILRWVQKFGPALSKEIRRHRKPVGTTWLVGETYVKIQGSWHYLYRGVDQDGQVLDCWLSRTRDLAAAEAFFQRTITTTGCTPEHVVTDKATFYPSAIRTHAPGAKHTATGFYNLVISTNRCERNHGYVKSRIRPMRGLNSFACATRLFPALDAVQLVERGFVHVPSTGAPCAGGRSYVRVRRVAAIERTQRSARSLARRPQVPFQPSGEKASVLFGLLRASAVAAVTAVAATAGEGDCKSLSASSRTAVSFGNIAPNAKAGLEVTLASAASKRLDRHQGPGRGRTMTIRPGRGQCELGRCRPGPQHRASAPRSQRRRWTAGTWMTLHRRSRRLYSYRSPKKGADVHCM